LPVSDFFFKKYIYITSYRCPRDRDHKRDKTVNPFGREDMKENRSRDVFVTGGVVGAASFVVTALRVFTRVKIIQGWWTEDGYSPTAGIIFLIDEVGRWLTFSLRIK